jgi:hypothetical protein
VTRSLVLRDQLVAGLIAGLAGGVVIALFLLAVGVAGGRAPADALAADTWTLGAPSLAGGLALHFFIAVAWALGYVYLLRTQPQLLTRPWVSGLGFGLVVYVFMGVVQIMAGRYHRPSPTQFEISLLAHVVFYGLPVGLIVARTLRRA